MILAIVVEANEKFSEAKERRDRAQNSDSVMTIAIRNVLIREVTTTAVVYNFAIRSQTVDQSVVRQLVRCVIDVQINKLTIRVVDCEAGVINCNHVLLDKSTL